MHILSIYYANVVQRKWADDSTVIGFSDIDKILMNIHQPNKMKLM